MDQNKIMLQEGADEAVNNKRQETKLAFLIKENSHLRGELEDLTKQKELLQSQVDILIQNAREGLKEPELVLALRKEIELLELQNKRTIRQRNNAVGKVPSPLLLSSDLLVFTASPPRTTGKQ